MADQPKSSDPKSLEMRVAELEDKLSKVHITEEEMKAYQKVASLMGAQGGTTPALTPQSCVINCIVYHCTIIRNCTIVRYCTIVNQCIINQCINECGGGCLPGGGIAGGGGFGTLGG